MAEETSMTSDQIQQAMAEKRLSLSESFFELEKEAGKRIRYTMDHVQNKIIHASDEITRTVTKPIHAVQESLEKVPQAFREKPVKSLLIVASAGLALGYLVGRRGRNRHVLTRVLAATNSQEGETRAVIPVDTRKTVSRGFLATVAMEAAHQIVLNSIFSLIRRRH